MYVYIYIYINEWIGRVGGTSRDEKGRGGMRRDAEGRGGMRKEEDRSMQPIDSYGSMKGSMDP